MNFPDDFKRKLERRLEEDRKAAERAKEKERAIQEELKKIAALRQKNKKELMILAEFAAKWISDFYKSKPGKKAIKAAYGSLILFSSSEFFDDVRVLRPDTGIHSEIVIYGDGSLIYRECYKSYGSRRIWDLGSVGKNSADLFKKLHPEYLELFLKHLVSGKIWKIIKNQIK